MIGHLLIILGTFIYPSYPGNLKGLTKADAIKLAEEFVRKNGYTNDTIGLNKANIQYESLEWYSNADSILKYRFNTLKPLAYAAKKYGHKWYVGFEYHYRFPETNPNYLIGRVVIIAGNSKEIRIEHQDIHIDALKE